MSASEVKTAFSGGQNLVPIQPSFTQLVQAGLNGGSDTASFFMYQSAMRQFIEWINSNPSGWIETTDPQGNPAYFAQESFQGGAVVVNYVVSIAPSQATSLDPEVNADIANNPAPFIQNGDTYNVVGIASSTLTINGVAFLAGNTLVGSSSLLGASMFASLATPLLKAFWNGIRTAFSEAATAAEAGTEAAVVAAGEAAAAGATGEATVAGGVVLFTAAAPVTFIVMVVAFTVAIASYFLLHYSYHNIVLYNFTPFDLYWLPPYLAHGAMSSAPLQANNNFFQTIPAIQNIAPAGLTPVAAATQVSFGFASKSSMSSVGYVLPLEVKTSGTNNVLQTAALLFDIPWAGENSLWAEFQSGTLSNSDLENMYSKYAGKFQKTAFSSNVSVSTGGQKTTLTVSATFDYLSGEHPMPSGGTGYYYNSIVSFNTQS